MTGTMKLLNERSLAFAVRVVKMARYLNERRKEFVLAKQILRSGTGIGANVRESVFAQSTADFVSKLSIALKEASETQYWLELLKATDCLTERQYAGIRPEVDWLVGTLVNVIKSNKRKLEESI